MLSPAPTHFGPQDGRGRVLSPPAQVIYAYQHTLGGGSLGVAHPLPVSHLTGGDADFLRATTRPTTKLPPPGDSSLAQLHVAHHRTIGQHLSPGQTVRDYQAMTVGGLS